MLPVSQFGTTTSEIIRAQRGRLMLLPVILKSLLVTVAVLLGMGFILALVTGGIARLINRGGG